METYELTEEYMRFLLGEAYKAGWYGTLELQPSAVQQILDRHLSRKYLLDTQQPIDTQANDLLSTVSFTVDTGTDVVTVDLPF